MNNPAFSSSPYGKYTNKTMTVTVSDAVGRYAKSELDYVDRFYSLLKQWRMDTLFVSSITEAVEHPAFKGILALGEKAIPLIISEIERYPDLLIESLPILTGKNPVSDSDMGDIPTMAATWIEWYHNQ